MEKLLEQIVNKLSFIETELILLASSSIKPKNIEKVFKNTKYENEFEEIMKKD